MSADSHAPAAGSHGGHGQAHDPALAHHPGHHDPTLAHHFDSVEQQSEATTLGMWVFLVTEIMFFGGVFCAYLVYRMNNSAAFAAGSHHLDIMLGGFNTVVLIVSSLTMAFAVRQAALGHRKTYVPAVVATMILGATFLVVKYFEYKEKFDHHLVPGPNFKWPDPMLQNGAEMFYSIYFFMTGLHALHMIVGLALLTVILVEGVKAASYTARFKTRVETMGLYWHFVDIVWIFLFPLLYLLGRH